ncbi:hypothetical protein R3W88_027452 [Solanum pinnatisectum]|uniref:Peroxidase n=1 Tax=Solanum pinnatisectum TaxID=50273 RepID=A0AAV9LGY3_9SOLN|nr:hypothetical protein R3W88_027452 [Solanum pinnatisectum]
MASNSFFVLHVFVMFSLASMALSDSLSPSFYDHVCPEALPAIKRVVEDAVKQERRMGASLLRLHFHDCFVNGCDASILLDKTTTIDSEKTAIPNNNSIRGFDVIDKIKSEVDKCCGRSIVSCADIVAVAARDSVVAEEGIRLQQVEPQQTMISHLHFWTYQRFINSFKKQGLDEKDLVALSGGHTLGFAQCSTFRNRIYNDTNIDSTFASQRKANCPRRGGNTNLAPLDPTPALFDSKYFSNLVSKKGLLHSDQELFNGGQTDNLVKKYSTNLGSFSKDYAEAMIKMGNIKPLDRNQGQIRVNCRKWNV